MDSRYRNLLDIDDPDQSIYRVFSVDRLFEIFRESKLTLVRPMKWDDPFENFLFTAKAKLPSGELVSLERMRQEFYGQCWTLTEESDAMWRIYAHNKDGVKVRTMVRKLFDTIYDHNYQFAILCFFIGRVQYLSEDQIRRIMSDPNVFNALLFDTSGVGQVRTLLVKRKEFDHEREVRLLFRGNREYHNLDDDTFQFDIDPLTLFDEIVFDPRISESDFKDYSSELEALGYCGMVRQSGLYKVPNLEIVLGS